jgi:alcohol dehydrogenase, propanol-preferring
MKAAVLRTVGEPLSIEEVPTPVPGPGELLVKIAGAGVCHSDIHLKDGSIPLSRSPIILGHENAGWVEKLGPGTRGFAPGDPVVVYGGWGCGGCRFCLGGQEQLCDTGSWGGLGPNGGYAEYMLVPSARHLIRADGLDLVEAAGLTDAGLTPYRAVKKTLPYLPPGSAALLIGAGGLGQYGVQFLKLLTQTTVIVVETAAAKRELAVKLGADVVIDGTAPDALDQVRAAAGGEGVNAALDFVGIDSTMQLGVSALARQAIFVLVGLAGGSVPFSFFGTGSETVITTSNWGSRNDLAELVALAQAGKLITTTERHSLDDINEVFERLERGQVQGRGVVIP